MRSRAEERRAKQAAFDKKIRDAVAKHSAPRPGMNPRGTYSVDLAEQIRCARVSLVSAALARLEGHGFFDSELRKGPFDDARRWSGQGRRYYWTKPEAMP